MNQWINFAALGKILIFGLICGAGLPALFALGLRALQMGARQPVAVAAGAGGSIATSEQDGLADGSLLGKIIAAICFLVVLGAVAWGIYWIVSA